MMLNLVMVHCRLAIYSVKGLQGLKLFGVEHDTSLILFLTLKN